MNISISDKNNFYTYLSEIGYYGLDVPFEDFDKKEYILSDEYTDYIAKKAKDIADAGLKVCQTHLTYYPGHLKPIGSGTYEEFEEYMLPILIKEINLAKLMNCKVCVLHPYFETGKEGSRLGNIKLLSKLLPVAEECGVIVAMENIYGDDYIDVHVSTAEDFMFYMEHFKSSNLGICLDTGHAVILKQDPLNLFRKLKDHIVAMHMHTTIDTIDLHAIPYTVPYGETNWCELYNEMKASGYPGTLNFELTPHRKLSDDAKKAYYQLAYETAKTIMGE